MAVYFTSDTHFGHANVIKLSARPFNSVDEMDQTLINFWNETITPQDVIYHLGDFSYKNSKSVEHYVKQLNGEIHLIVGNHDSKILKTATDLFASASDIKRINIERQELILCHYPMREWQGAWRRAWHLFGHVHGNFDDNPLGHSMDVGVDSHNFRPISFKQVKQALKDRVSPFGHRKKHKVNENLL